MTLVRVLERVQLDVARPLVPADIAEQQRQDVGRRERRIGAQLRLQALHGADGPHDHLIGLSRNAHARLGFHVEERLDSGGVREVDVAARHDVPPSLERHLAAIYFGPPEEQRVFVRAAQLQVRARDEPGEVVFHTKRCRNHHFDVESERHRGRGRGRVRDGDVAAASELEQTTRRVDAAIPGRAPDRNHARQRRRLHAAAKREVRVNRRAHAFGVAQVHALAAQNHAQIARQVAVQADPAAELHAATPHRGRKIVEPDASRVEADRPVDRLERVRQREMTEATVGDRRASGKDRLVQGAVDGRRQRRAPRSAHVPEEALQDAEVGVARGAHGDALSSEVDRPSDGQARVLPHQLQILDPHDVLIERQLQRTGIAQRQVEQTDVDTIDRRFDEQVIQIGDVSDHPNRSARHGRCVRQKLRDEQANIRVQRTVVEPERHFRVAFGLQRQPPGCGQRQSGRRRIELAADLPAPKRERARHETNRLLADGQVGDTETHVVPRVLERAAPGGGEIGQSRGLGARIRERGSLLDGDPPAVGVERIRPVPPYESRPGDGRRRFRDVDRVEAHPCPIEPERGRSALKRFSKGNACIDRDRAESDGPLVLAGQMEIAAQSSRDRPVVELKCVTKLGEVGAGDAKPCVDFFAGVGPWIAERKHSVGTDLGAARSDGRVSNRDIAVFDDEMARAITPDRVPRPEVLAAEIAVDTRTTEGSGHDTVEFAAAPERDGGRFRAKVRQDAGEDLVALLPVAARHVKAD